MARDPSTTERTECERRDRDQHRDAGTSQEPSYAGEHVRRQTRRGDANAAFGKAHQLYPAAQSKGHRWPYSPRRRSLLKSPIADGWLTERCRALLHARITRQAARLVLAREPVRGHGPPRPDLQARPQIPALGADGSSDPRLRASAVQGALPAHQSRLGRQRGAKVAQIELARKLTEAIWYMLTRNQPFKPFAPEGAISRLTA